MSCHAQFKKDIYVFLGILGGYALSNESTFERSFTMTHDNNPLPKKATRAPFEEVTLASMGILKYTWGRCVCCRMKLSPVLPLGYALL